MRTVTVSTPASTANLGAGFDCLALALDLRNVVELTDLGEGSGLELTAEGEGAGRVPLDSRNLIYRAAAGVFERVGRGNCYARVKVGESVCMVQLLSWRPLQMIDRPR